jgi:hypothetical protein
MLTNKSSVKKLIEIISPVFPAGMERKSSLWKSNLLDTKKYIQSANFAILIISVKMVKQ